MGLIFARTPLFSGFRYANPEIFEKKSLEMGNFFRKNPHTWVLFLGKIIPEHGYGSRAAGSTSPTNPNLRPPRVQELLPFSRNFLQDNELFKISQKTNFFTMFFIMIY